MIPREAPEFHWERPADPDPSASRRWLIGFLPLVVFALLAISARDYLATMYDPASGAGLTVGLAATGLAAVLMIVGVLVMRSHRSRTEVAIAFGCLTLPSIIVLLVGPAFSLVAAHAS